MSKFMVSMVARGVTVFHCAEYRHQQIVYFDQEVVVGAKIADADADSVVFPKFGTGIIYAFCLDFCCQRCRGNPGGQGQPSPASVLQHPGT